MSLKEAGREKDPLLVETDWLEANDGRGDVVVVDARRWALYLVGHIPRAVSFPMRKVTDESSWRPGFLPSDETIVRLLGEAGIGAEDHVVIYDDGDGLAASRVFWALDYLGHERLSLLNGGFSKWSFEGRSRTVKRSPRQATRYEGSPRPERLATSGWISERLTNGRGLVIIDCRTFEEYTGAKAKAQRAGHIPEAVHVEWTRNLRETGAYPAFRSREELSALYRQVGAGDGLPAVTYCQAQVRGSQTYFVLRWLGFDVKGYEGSWAEWGNDSELPVVLGSEPGSMGDML